MPPETLEECWKLLEQRESELKQASSLGKMLLEKLRNREDVIERQRVDYEQLMEKYETLCAVEEEKDEMEKALVQTRNDRNDLQIEFQGLQRDFNILQREVDGHKRILENNKELRKKEIQTQDEILNLRNELKSVEEKSNKLKKQNQRLSEKIKQLNQELKSEGESPNVDDMKKVESKVLSRKLSIMKHKLHSVQHENDLQKMNARKEKTNLLLKHEELKTKLKDHENYLIVKEKLSHVYAAMNELRKISQKTRDQCVQELNEMAKKVTEVRTSLQSFIQSRNENEPLSKDASFSGYRIIDAIGYVELQSKCLEDLGLDAMYESFGHKNIQPKKQGMLRVAYKKGSLLGTKVVFEPRWIVLTAFSISVWKSSEQNVILRRDAIEGILCVRQKPKEDFSLYCPPNGELRIKADSEQEREEWLGFFKLLQIEVK